MSPRALLVEPEELVADMIQVNLEKVGYELILAGDGVQALSLVKENEFDLILLGLDLTKDTDLGLVREIRQQGVKAPMVVLTSGGDTQKRVNTLEMGADDYLPKPFEMTEFMARINAVLKRHGKT